MKKSFFLYFLVISPLIFSQNNEFLIIEDLKNNPVFQIDAISFNSAKQFVILDTAISNENNSWMLTPNLKKFNDDREAFTSLLLIQQLEELNLKTPFHVAHNPTLERFIRVFLRDRREKLGYLMDRSTYYFPIFEAYLDKYDLPIELKYLAIIESALKADANSTAGAKGLWQFMYGTGKQFDLEINSFVDERFDPIKSTEAACKYLSSLYNTFKDWDLALAAYNCGPGNVSKAIKRAGGKTSYWEIRDFLPLETQGYLPAFYATYYIFEYAKSHNLMPIKSELSYLEIDTIHLKKQLSFHTIQQQIGIDYHLLKTLNPQYKKEIIPISNEKKYAITLPKNLIETFILQENNLYNAQKNVVTQRSPYPVKVTNQNSYTVKAGDNLSKIAAIHHISLEQLKKWNGLHTEYLITDQRLVITDKIMNETQENGTETTENADPFSPEISPIFSSIDSDKEITKTSNYFKIYTVKEGDTLFKISKIYPDITINQIRDWNNIWDVKYLRPGTKLKLFKS